MATAIPQRKRIQTGRSNAPFENNANQGLQLSYAGKKSESTIIATPPAELSTLWATHEQAEYTSANRLYFEDNLAVLATLLRDESVRGKIALIYIDPPYATGGAFQSRQQEEAYDDSLVGPAYVEFLRERLVLLRELLAENGSIYLHLDKNMAFEMKVIMDEIFGAKNFRGLITRKKCNPKNYTTRSYGNVADYLLFYSKSENYVWNRAVEKWNDQHAAKEYPCVDEKGRRFKKVPVHAPGVRNGETGQLWRGVAPPPGKHWQYRPSTLDEMDARGEIYWSPTGNPRRKVYLDQSDGVPIQDIWLDARDAHNQNIHITGFPTEKNPALLKRIVEASSNPGDLVLDCFCGSGTTLAVASQLKRHWIGVDSSSFSIATTLRRFANGLRPMGDFVSAQRTEHQPTLFLAPDEPTLDSPSHIADDFSLWADWSLSLNVEDASQLDLMQVADLFDSKESSS